MTRIYKKTVAVMRRKPGYCSSGMKLSLEHIKDFFYTRDLLKSKK